MKNPGFMLLELLVSMVIASMIALALFAAFAQTNRAVHTVDDMVDISYKQTVAINQLAKDISGAFIPIQGRKKKQTSAAEQQQDAKIKEQAQKKFPESKKEKKRLTKIFYGTTKNEQLDLLTCITNNSTLEYPLGVVRILYRLVPETRFNPKKPAYVLLRQESSKLEFDDFAKQGEKENSIRAYELIGNVKKITIEYTAVINKPVLTSSGKENKSSQLGQAGAEPTKEQRFEREYKVLNEWVMEQEQEEKFKNYQKVPFAVDVDLVLWDERKERERSVSFKIMLPNEIVEYEVAQKQTSTHATQTKQQQQSGATTGKQQTTPGSSVSKQAGGKTAHNKAGSSALDQTLSALKTMLLADGAVAPQGGKS